MNEYINMPVIERQWKKKLCACVLNVRHGDQTGTWATSAALRQQWHKHHCSLSTRRPASDQTNSVATETQTMLCYSNSSTGLRTSTHVPTLSTSTSYIEMQKRNNTYTHTWQHHILWIVPQSLGHKESKVEICSHSRSITGIHTGYIQQQTKSPCTIKHATFENQKAIYNSSQLTHTVQTHKYTHTHTHTHTHTRLDP